MSHSEKNFKTNQACSQQDTHPPVLIYAAVVPRSPKSPSCPTLQSDHTFTYLFIYRALDFPAPERTGKALVTEDTYIHPGSQPQKVISASAFVLNKHLHFHMEKRICFTMSCHSMFAC